MSLRTLILLLTGVILLAGLTIGIASWVSGSLPDDEAGFAWLLPVLMGLAVFVRYWARRNDP